MDNVFTQSIWGDEGFSAILSMKPLPEIIKIIATDTSPPLWNIWEWLFFNLFGTSEVVIRSLSLIFFLGTAFFAFKIGKFLWDRKTGYLAALLTLLNPFFFTYAFEGRMYSILALGVTASMHFLLKIIYAKGKVEKANIFGYVIATLWAMYSHHFAIFILIIQGLWVLRELVIGNWKLVIPMLKAFALIALGYLPWIIPLYNQTKMVGSGFWLGTPTVANLLGLLEKYLGTGITHPWSTYALIFFLLLFVLRKWSPEKKVLILLSWFLGPIVMTWIVSQFFQSIFFDRYLLYTIPGAMILTASKRSKLSIYILSILSVILVTIDVHYFTHPTKRPFRELATYVKETRQHEDFLINWNAAGHHLWETKYYDIAAPIYIPGGGELPFFVGTALMGEGDIIHEIPEGVARVGIVTSGSIDEVSLAGYTLDTAKSFRNPWEGAAEINFIWLQKDENR